MHDIVDTAVAAGSFKTLVAAVTAAGLVDMICPLLGGPKYMLFWTTQKGADQLKPELIICQRIR